LAPHSKSSKSVNQGRFDVNIRAHSTAQHTRPDIGSAAEKRRDKVDQLCCRLRREKKVGRQLALIDQVRAGNEFKQKIKKDDAEGLWLSRAEEPWRDTRLVSFPVFHKIIKCDQTLFFFCHQEVLKKTP
jgi:hypothetical protein